MFDTTAHRAAHPASHRGSGRRRPRWWLPVVLAVFVASGAGAADAYWSSSGEGPGSGTTATPVALTLSPGTPATSLRPGAEADVALTISNPNAVEVRLATLTLDLSQGAAGITVDAAHASCDTASLTFAPQSAGWTVPARAGSVDGSLVVVLTDALSMGIDAADACQGAEFGINLQAGS